MEKERLRLNSFMFHVFVRSQMDGLLYLTPNKAYTHYRDIFLMTEIQRHIGLMSWAKTQPILSEYLIHIPNGGYRHPKEAIKLKKMGVKAGVSDLFLAYPNPYYHAYGLI